jgi:hypothetical protein
MRGLRGGIAALTLLFGGCETIPTMATARPDAVAAAKTKSLLDQRSELSRSSYAERSGANPIVLLGDERFDKRPIDVLESEIDASLFATSQVAIRRFDIRYLQGGNVDSLTYGLTLGVSGAGAILGTVLYGAMAGHARAKSPSSLEIVIEGKVDDVDFSVKHGEALAASNESLEIKRVVEVAARLAVTEIKKLSTRRD